MWPNPKETADLVTFIGEIFNGKLHFLCMMVACFENEWQVHDGFVTILYFGIH